MEQTDIVAICPLDPALQQTIICQTEHRRGKQIISIPIGGEGTRLADQGPDHMMIINMMLLLTNQTREGEDDCAANIAFQRLRSQSHQQSGPNQTGGDRIDIGFNMNGTKLTHRDSYFLAGSQWSGWQRLKGLFFSDKPCGALELA